MLIKEELLQKGNLSPIECEIANQLLSLGMSIQKKTIRNVAKECYTSPSTLVRLCKKLGFNGWDEFKEKYIDELNYLESHFQNIDANKPFVYGDTDMMIANKLGNLYQETIKDTLNLLHHDSLQHASRIVKNSKRIFVFSIGTSLDIAEAFHEKMLKIGKNVTLSRNEHFQFLEASQMEETDCAIIISYSGETSKIIDIAKLLKQKSIPFITLTSFGNNTLNQLSPCTLYISTREKLISNIASFSSNLSISFLLDLLFSFVFSNDFDNHLKYKIKVSRQLEKSRHSDNSILKED